MGFVMFHEYCPEIAPAETRSITIREGGSVPADDYALLEMYCDEPGCDCRRVFLAVLARQTKQVEAIIAFGWESTRHYREWLGTNDPDELRDLKGPVLSIGCPQGKHAPALLRLVEEYVLQDPDYVRRLQRHYRMFRERIEAGDMGGRFPGDGSASRGEPGPPSGNRAERRRAERQQRKARRMGL